MELILKEDIKGLGFKNDVVNVKPGYGRNYLIPQGLALVATESSKKVVAENVKQAAHKAERLKNDAIELAAKINGLSLEIATKVGETGKIFGKITSLQVSDALKAKGIDVDRKKIAFKEDVKNVGEYTAHIDLHKEVKTTVAVKVVGE
ncbi:MAG TPA: 50S ribosomal protein L9 [Cytophagales bacterium]|jgi:large subunit ribosomal protein L9|nr:50S ribosomal protein L9 [Cytophagales bacterium]